jgi:hypothetical protein
MERFFFHTYTNGAMAKDPIGQWFDNRMDTWIDAIGTMPMKLERALDGVRNAYITTEVRDNVRSLREAQGEAGEAAGQTHRRHHVQRAPVGGRPDHFQSCLQAWSGRHRVEADRHAVPIRPMQKLGQGEEPDEPRDAPDRRRDVVSECPATISL